ncbi:MAG TPA: LamG-like jellyroll fold domain-containing protein [Ignavibacteriaceae bacterium]|nr:LamG-like jellyroll fold domain-containing protein [Ignavibacteriaceae bacterium]
MKTNWGRNLFIILINLPGLVFTQQNLICPEEMVAYWKLDDESGSNIFLDSYGRNDGLCNSPFCPSTVSGILNGALYFNNSKIEVLTTSNFNWTLGSSFTVEAWIKTTQTDSGRKVFLGKHRGGSQMAWWLGISENKRAMFSVRDSDADSSIVEGINIINDGNWHHIIGVKDGLQNVLQIYVDGIRENEEPTSYSGHFIGSGPLFIGYYIDYYSYSGLIDEIAVYNKALNEIEVAINYNNIIESRGYCNAATDVTVIEVNPDNYFLSQNYPNPFNPSTRIKYFLPAKSMIVLKVFDVLGNEIAQIVSEEKQPGNYEQEINLHSFSSGMYIYQLQAENYSQIRKMILLK